jgi:hypothetical protein
MADKKYNPNKLVPIKEIDRVLRKASRKANVIFYWVMWEKFHFTESEMLQLEQEINYLADSITKGYVSLDDLEKTLEEEDIVHFE